jgi:hypothetical protein
MERQSGKHNPRLDDEMKKEVGAFTHGAPVDSRAQEAREKEAFPGGDGLSPAERRHDLARYIEGRVFPATREEIVASAVGMHAPPAVVERLEMLPSRFYDGFPDVWEALHPSESKRWAG